MNAEKRSHQRIEPKNLSAHITIKRPPNQEIVTDGTVIDISYSGIKIQLNTPMLAKTHDKITIDITLPQSGIPINIHGVVKHRLPDAQCGIYFGDLHPEEYVDDLMFECVMHTHSTPN